MCVWSFRTKGTKPNCSFLALHPKALRQTQDRTESRNNLGVDERMKWGTLKRADSSNQVVAKHGFFTGISSKMAAPKNQLATSRACTLMRA